MAKQTTAVIETPFVAFTDETGNSGLNLFDKGQPYFWTGTLLTPVDLDALDPAVHAACLSRAGCNELHGNNLGFSGIERIAGKIKQLLYRYQATFLFTRIDKSHLAATKFVDTILDSGLNKAVSNFHYGIRLNRLYLAHIIVALLDQDDRQEFWGAYATGDAEGFRRICMRVEGRVVSHVDDARTRQLLQDAITWALAHSEPLLEGTRSPLDSPNVVALTLLVHELHRLNELTGLTVRTFIHDEQQEFAKYLNKAFEISKQFGSVNATSPLAMIINIKDMATFDCGFRTVSSKKSFGLQLLDVALWLTKRFTDNPDGVHGKSRELAKQIRKRGFISEFTHEAMVTEVERGFDRLFSTPLSAEKETRGRKLLAEIEATRLQRMQEALTGSTSPMPEMLVTPEPATE
jgi:hypothetical protein